MGEELARKSEQPTGKNPGSNDPGKTGGTAGTGGHPAGNPRPASTAGGTDPRTGGTGNPAGGKTPEKQNEKTSGLPSVSPAVPAPETPKKNQKRKPTKKKKSEPDTFNADQISALILSASAIVGSRPGLEVFTLQPTEAMQLATPIANMMAKSEALQNMGQYADAISLVTASLIIFAPRFMVYSDQQKKKKIEAAGGVKLVRKETKNDGGTGKPSGTGTPKPENDASGIYAAIPVTL